MSKKPLLWQERNMVFNVSQRILYGQGAEQTQSSILNHVQALTGVSNTTIRRIVAEGRSNRGVFSLSGKNRKVAKKTYDSFDLKLIRININEFYTVRKEIPTVMKLLQILWDDINFNGGRESLRLILKDIGFELVKCQSKRTILMERHDIKIHRFKYLERMQKNREADDKLYVVYLD